MVRICQLRLTTSWLLLTTRISRDLVRVAPVPVAPSPLCLSVCPDTALSIRFRGTTCTFASGDAAPLLGLLSRQARHESNCNSIVVSLRHLPLYPTPPLPACLLSFCWPRFRFGVFRAKCLNFFFARQQFAAKIVICCWARAILISCRRLLVLLRGGVLRVVIAIVIVLVLWQLCILFRYLSHSLANAAQSFA